MFCKPKGKVVGETIGIASHLLIQSRRSHPVKPGQVRVQHDSLATQHEYSPGNSQPIIRANRSWASTGIVPHSAPVRSLQNCVLLPYSRLTLASRNTASR